MSPKYPLRSVCILVLLVVLGGFMAQAADSVQVRGYQKKDGTYVAPHTRSAPRKSSSPSPSGTYFTPPSLSQEQFAPSLPALGVHPTPPGDPKEVQRKAGDVDARVVTFLRERMADGSADAAYDLAVRHLSAKGVEKSPDEARRLMLRASERGNEEAAKWLKTNAAAAKEILPQ